MTTIPDPQIYRAAADVIRENGWTQGSFVDKYTNLSRRIAGEPELPPERCPVCLLGAVNLVVTGDPKDGKGEGADARYWLRQFTDDYPAGWNDAPGRTEADVLDLLARAASAAESARAAQDGGGVDYQCQAEWIGEAGAWTDCSCPECMERKAGDREADIAAQDGGEGRG